MVQVIWGLCTSGQANGHVGGSCKWLMHGMCVGTVQHGWEKAYKGFVGMLAKTKWVERCSLSLELSFGLVGVWTLGFEFGYLGLVI